MKRILLFVFLLAMPLLALLSCQVERFDSEKANPENLTRDAQLTRMLRRMSATDTVSDHAVDSASCFRIKRPYQVIVHDQQGDSSQEVVHTVSDDTSQSAVNEAIDALHHYEGDWIMPVFPVTIVFEDGTEQTIQNASQWETAGNACSPSGGNTDPINCINVNYPITIFGYDTNYQLANTYVIENDAQLFALLGSIQPGQYFALDYPISLTFSDGNVVTVSNNQELVAALNQATGLCDAPDPCGGPNLLTEGLIIYVPFANEARDLVSGSNLVYNDNFPPQLTTDRSGNVDAAISFSGAALDFLKIDETTENHLKQGDSLTISLWFRMQNTDPSNLEKFFEKSEDSNVAFFLGAYDMNRPLFFSNIGGVQSLWDLTWNNDALWNDTTNWHHIAVTIESDTNTVRIYRDGTLVATDVNSDFNITSEYFSYFLGRGFKGHLDDLRVYRHTLNASQISELAQQPGDIHTCLN